MKNILLWGFDSPIACHAFKALEEQGIISVKAWFGDRKESSVVTHTWYDLAFEDLKKAPELYCEEAIYKKVYASLYIFMDLN